MKMAGRTDLVRYSLLFVLAGLLTLNSSALGQKQSDREKGFELYEASNFVDALPYLEKAAKETPNDPAVLSRLGFALFASSSTEKDPAERKKIRDRAREVLLKSQSLGDDSNLTRATLEGLSVADDSSRPFSKQKEAEEEIRKGEKEFVRGNLDAALAAYQRALALDPQLYEAALYAGDMEFKKAYNSQDEPYRQEHFDKAGVWFAKAIAIDPNRETAYRYWGDALDGQRKIEEARDRFVDAIVAEPYGNRSPYDGLAQWAERHNVSLAQPKIDIPSSVSQKKPGEVSITVDDLALKGSDDGSAAWLMYGLIRASWMTGKDGARSEEFAKAYPNETAYRHSLAEEAAALRGVIASLKEQMKDKPSTKLSPSFKNLVALNDAGLLEPYVLFARPDAGIARDYFSYRKSNREKLKEYWLKFVIGR